jgi:hypothetical protein
VSAVGNLVGARALADRRERVALVRYRAVSEMALAVEEAARRAEVTARLDAVLGAMGRLQSTAPFDKQFNQ